MILRSYEQLVNFRVIVNLWMDERPSGAKVQTLVLARQSNVIKITGRDILMFCELRYEGHVLLRLLKLTAENVLSDIRPSIRH